MNRLGENVGTHGLVLLASPAIIRSAVSSSSSSAPVRPNATLEITPASNLRPVAPLLSMRNQDDPAHEARTDVLRLIDRRIGLERLREDLDRARQIVGTPLGDNLGDSFTVTAVGGKNRRISRQDVIG